MTVIAKVFVDSKIAESVQTTQYTAPSGFSAIIDKFTATNITGSDVAFSVNLVVSGANAANSNLIVKYKFISAGRTYTFPELTGHVLSTGESISTLSSVTNGLTIRVSGREVS